MYRLVRRKRPGGLNLFIVASRLALRMAHLRRRTCLGKLPLIVNDQLKQGSHPGVTENEIAQKVSLHVACSHVVDSSNNGVVSKGARYIVHRYTVATCHLCLSSCSLDDPDLSPIAVSLDLKRLLQVEDGWDCSLACSRSGVVIDVPITVWSFHNYID